MKKSNGGLNGSPKGRRVPLRAVRPILFSSPPMIGLCGGEFKNLSQRAIKMTNSNLITVFNGQIANQAIQLANARELHTFLESQQRFTDWIGNRISDYGFIQDEDYIIVTERTNGRPRKEYHITLDMGKELAMVERNEKGRQIRKYFIECERKANLQNEQQNQPLVKPEVRYPASFTGAEIYSLVWLLISHRNMNDLLGELEQPLAAIGSNFHPAVYSHHREYKRLIDENLPILKRLIEPFKESNPIEFERIKSRLKLN
ncbi:antA/AntB antirepressor family protein [Glaesserella parasuis]|nr:antA/AntB antirepressor family protein [Glaesserella parasuis]MDG6761899.1 antA/AntB antirepressor family protein [Glaesserella parasuis]